MLWLVALLSIPCTIVYYYTKIVVMLMSCSAMIVGSGDLQPWALSKRHLQRMHNRDSVSFLYGSLGNKSLVPLICYPCSAPREHLVLIAKSNWRARGARHSSQIIWNLAEGIAR
jgi:hypothetical protein